MDNLCNTHVSHLTDGSFEQLTNPSKTCERRLTGVYINKKRTIAVMERNINAGAKVILAEAKDIIAGARNIIAGTSNINAEVRNTIAAESVSESVGSFQESVK